MHLRDGVYLVKAIALGSRPLNLQRPVQMLGALGGKIKAPFSLYRRKPLLDCFRSFQAPDRTDPAA